MRIVHIVEALGGGIHSYFEDLSNYLEHHHGSGDIKSYLIYSGNRKEIDPQKIHSEFSNTFELIEISMTREISPFKDIRATYQLVRVLRKIKPDVIHLHSSKAGILGRIANFFTFRKNTLFYTPHGYSFVREDISKAKKNLYWLIEKNTIRFLGGTTIACGDTEYEFAKQIGPSLLVRNGIDSKLMAKFKRDKKEQNYVIGTIGRISPQKNPVLFNNIALKFPDIKFIWVGNGEQRDLLTAPNIEVTGWLPRAEALDIINDFNIYIQTSLWEGLPFTIIEAMALEKPIIATNVIGNKDAVKQNYNGFLCSSLEEFEKVIITFKKDSSLEMKMGMSSKNRAKEIFDKDSNFEKLISLYKSY